MRLRNAQWPQTTLACLSPSLEKAFPSLQSVLGLIWPVGILLDQWLLAGVGHRQATCFPPWARWTPPLSSGNGQPCKLKGGPPVALVQMLAPYHLHFRLKFTSSEKRVLTTWHKASSTCVFLTPHFLPFFLPLFFSFFPFTPFLSAPSCHLPFSFLKSIWTCFLSLMYKIIIFVTSRPGLASLAIILSIKIQPYLKRKT